MGPLPSREYVFVLVDYYSRYFEAAILTSVTSTKVIERMEKIFCTHGLPQSLKTDNGPQFVSEEFEVFLKENDIKHRTSTPLWPQATGEVERQNRSLLKTLKIAKTERKNLWTELRKFLTAYRTTPHSIRGVTPAKLLFNREVRSKVPELRKSGCTDSEARDKDAEMKQSTTDYADKKRRAQESDLELGDQVLLKQKKDNKLSTRFESVPYNVSGRYGSEVVVTSPEGVNYMRNVTDVKKYLREAKTTEKQATGHDAIKESVTKRVAEPPGRPTRERKLPEYLNDYEVYRLG